MSVVGYTGTVPMRNGKVSDVIEELRKLIDRYENNGEVENESYDLSEQLRRLAEEIGPIVDRPTIINGNPGQSGLSASLLVHAATLGALGYGYMRRMGISLSDFMNVAKRRMSIGVENFSKHLEQVSEALAEVKRNLAQRIDDLDRQQQEEISRSIKSEMGDVFGDLSLIMNDARSDISRMRTVMNAEIKSELDEVHRMIAGLDDKFRPNQKLTNIDVFLHTRLNGKRAKVPQRRRQQPKAVGSPVPSLVGLKELDALESGIVNRRLIIRGFERRN